ncbi:MAG: c-type cytochrome biogenesis protein CcmI [Betaproteobacteria bacterium]
MITSTMPLFWTLAALMVTVTLGVLTWPLLRGTRRFEQPDANAASLAVLRDQKRMLDAEYAAGSIGEVERDAAIDELAHRLDRETGGDISVEMGEQSRAGRVETSASPRHRWLPLTLVAVIVPVAAFLLYHRLGNPAAIDATAGAPGHNVTEVQIVTMVETLANRMQQHPEDADGWLLLARSYQALDRFPESANAYARAAALIKNDANLLADYADVLAMAHDRTLAGEPIALIERALAIDPRQRKALALAATAALEARDIPASLVYWRRLAAELPPGSDEVTKVASVIADVERAQRGGAPTSAPAAPEAATKAVARGGVVSGRVDVAGTLASKVTLDDTVFIFARAVDGSRMPLAVLRLKARALPADFVLDDSMAMAAGATLSSAPQVIVEARIAKGGGALPQPGDMFGRSAPIKPGTTDVRIVIDQVVP